MKALIIERPSSARVAELPDPRPADGEVLIRVMACGICGTDVHIFQGEYLGGYPITPGHEFSGVVEAVGAGVERFRVGDRVAVEPNIACNNCPSCLNNRQNFCERWQAIGVTLPGGMAELVVCPESAVVPAGALPFDKAAFMEPLSCVIHGVERARCRPGDRVLLLGAGPIGILLLRLLLLQGASEITVVERNASRLSVARRSGAAETRAGTDGLTTDFYDLVVDASGAPALEALSPRYARAGGTVLFFGVPPAGKTIEIEPFALFRKGLTLLGSYTSLRNSYQAVALIESGKLPVEDLVSHRLPLEEFGRAVETIRKGTEDAMKVMLFPSRT